MQYFTVISTGWPSDEPFVTVTHALNAQEALLSHALSIGHITQPCSPEDIGDRLSDNGVYYIVIPGEAHATNITVQP